MSPNPSTRSVQRTASTITHIDADICVIGSGAAGLSAALEAARIGRKTVLVEAGPTVGGQAVNSLIGTFCGLYSNGPEPHRVTYGIVDDMLQQLGRSDAISPRRGRNTIILMYDEVALARWAERRLTEAGVTVLTGAVLRGTARSERRIDALQIATRYGDVDLHAQGYVDASGDAALCWQAGLTLREPESPVYGSQMVTIEGIDEGALSEIGRPAMEARLAEKAESFGLMRRDGFVFAFPGRGIGLANMTHVETPMDPAGASRAALLGRDEADRLMSFLQAEFPDAFSGSQIRTYGQLGIRQTRWIEGIHHLTVDEVRAEKRFEDAVARCSWPIEMHQAADSAHWEEFGDDHMHFIPFGSLTPAETDNVVAAGRCIDADAVALSSVRVMGPCIAMGAAAAHALDLAGAGSVHQIDRTALFDRLQDNLNRTDPPGANGY